MATLVSGLFRSRADAERAVENLIHYGWSRDDVSLLMSDATRGREFGLAMATKAPEGAGHGGDHRRRDWRSRRRVGGAGHYSCAGAGTRRGRPDSRGARGAGRRRGCRRADGRADRTWEYLNTKRSSTTKRLRRAGILVGVYTHDDRTTRRARFSRRLAQRVSSKSNPIIFNTSKRDKGESQHRIGRTERARGAF